MGGDSVQFDQSCRMLFEKQTHIPTFLLRHGGFPSPGSKLLWLVLISYASSATGTCYPGRQRLAVEAIASIDTIDAYKKALREDGWLDWKRNGNGGMSNTYVVKIPEDVLSEMFAKTEGAIVLARASAPEEAEGTKATPQTMLQQWKELYAEIYRSPYPANISRDLGILKKLLAMYGADELVLLMAAFFGMGDEWIEQQGHTLTLFQNQIPKCQAYLRRLRERGE